MPVASGTGAYESGGNLDTINTAITALNTKVPINLDGIIVLASGVVSANGNSADQTNLSGKGIKLCISPGAFGIGALAITVTLQGKDPISGAYYAILTSGSQIASTAAWLLLYPGLAVAANFSSNDFLPKTWRVTWQATAWGTGGSTLGIAAMINA